MWAAPITLWASKLPPNCCRGMWAAPITLWAPKLHPKHCRGTYLVLPPNLYIVNLSFQSESNLAKGRFTADLLINRKFVENSGHMSMLISGQIDETIRFLEQTLMRMRV